MFKIDQKFKNSLKRLTNFVNTDPATEAEFNTAIEKLTPLDILILYISLEEFENEVK